ncbi:MAG: RHS repeat protein, partial [Desulfobacteraceae bacterium]
MAPDGLVTYTYDQGSNAKGKLTQVTDPSGSQTLEYDNLGRLELETRTINNISFQIMYGYNKNNELETMTYPSGRVVTYQKNIAGQISGMSTTYEANTVNLLQNMTRLPFGPVNGLTLGNGLNQVMTYDQLYRLTGSQTGSIYNRTYVYNANSNITNIQDLVTPAKNQTFVYDDLNRLTNATGNYGTIAYT